MRIFRLPLSRASVGMPLSRMNDIELLARDAAKPAARHAKSLELPGIETANDRLLADLADLGRFAGRKHSFH